MVSEGCCMADSKEKNTVGYYSEGQENNGAIENPILPALVKL